MKTLKERLADWTDRDCAAYELGVVLGLFPEWDERPIEPPHDNWGGTKWIFWTDNPLGNTLDAQLHEMADSRLLEFDPEDDRFRWNPTYAIPKGE